MTNEKITPFYGGVCSQWFACDFEVDGVRYNCTEQYMMAEKARLFGDKESERDIMSANHPRDQKAMGRRVKDFVRVEWDAISRDVVYKANYAKFTQNPDLEVRIRNTAGTHLVEASPTDRIWGVGRNMSEPAVYDPKKWRGTNWLGEVLMKVREDIIAGIETTEDFGWSTE